MSEGVLLADAGNENSDWWRCDDDECDVLNPPENIRCRECGKKKTEKDESESERPQKPEGDKSLGGLIEFRRLSGKNTRY